MKYMTIIMCLFVLTNSYAEESTQSRVPAMEKVTLMVREDIEKEKSQTCMALRDLLQKKKDGIKLTKSNDDALNEVGIINKAVLSLCTKYY